MTWASASSAAVTAADPHFARKLASIRSEEELEAFRKQLIADHGLTSEDMAAVEERRRAIRKHNPIPKRRR